MVGREVIVSSTFAFTKIVTDAFRIGIRDFGCGDFPFYRTRWHWLILQRRNHCKRRQGHLEGFYANGRFSTLVFELIRKAFKVLTDAWMTKLWGIQNHYGFWRNPRFLSVVLPMTSQSRTWKLGIRIPDSGTRSHGILSARRGWVSGSNQFLSHRKSFQESQLFSD